MNPVNSNIRLMWVAVLSTHLCFPCLSAPAGIVVGQSPATEPELLTLVMERDRSDGNAVVFSHHLLTARFSSSGALATVTSREITDEPTSMNYGRLASTDPVRAILWAVGPHWTSLFSSVEFDGNSWITENPMPFSSEASAETWALVQRLRADPSLSSRYHALALLSPDGSRLAHVIDVAQEHSVSQRSRWLPYVQDLMVTEIETGGTRCAFLGAIDKRVLVARPTFSPNSRYLAFQTWRAYPWLSEGWEPPEAVGDRLAEDLQVWDSETDETHVLTPRGYKPEYSLPGIFTLLAWDASSEKILFLRCETDPREDPDSEYRLWVADVVRGRAHQVPTFFRDFRQILWHPDGRSFVTKARRNGVTVFAHIALDGRWERVLWQTFPEGPQSCEPAIADHWAISPDGRWLTIWRVQSLYIVDLAEGSDTTPRMVWELPEQHRPLDMAWWTPSQLATVSCQVSSEEAGVSP